jgi:hypothetical protein
MIFIHGGIHEFYEAFLEALKLIPIPISSHAIPSPTGEGQDEGFK